MRTVLIADRSLTIRRVVEHALGGRAATVVGAADADELFRLARVETPDVVLCDAALPGVELSQLRDALGSVPGLEDVPLVLLTSALDPIEPDDASRYGASGLLVKPFEIASLNDAIERSLELGLLPARPELPPEGDGAGEDTSPGGGEGIPEPPSFESVWEETAEPETSAAPVGGAEVEEFAFEEVSEESGDDLPEEPGCDDPLALESRRPEPPGEDEEPLGPLSYGDAAYPAASERVPLPGDEDFRLGDTSLPDESYAAHEEPGERAGEPRLERLASLEPELRVLVERVVREVAWEVLPDIVERIVRERTSGVLPDSSSGDRKS